MNKKKLILGGATGAVLTLAALAVVSMVGVPRERPPEPGTDEYYVSGRLEHPLPEIITNLKSPRGKAIFNLEAVVTYEVGQELLDRYGGAGPLFAENENRIKDRLNRLILTKDVASVQGADNQALLGEQIREIVDKLVFPEQKGRVREVLFINFRHE